MRRSRHSPSSLTERGRRPIRERRAGPPANRGRSPGLAPREGLLRRAPELVGTVIAADQVYYENPDFSWARTLNRLLLLVEFLGLPLLLLWWLLAYAGPLSLILGVLGLFLLFKFLSPHNLFAMLGIFHLLNPFRRESRVAQVPVQYFRVRDSSQREYIVMRKGHLLSGNLMPGDEVALWGSLRRGTLHLQRGMNLRTGAQIALRRDHSWALILLNLVVLGTLVGLFYEPLKRILAAF